jgi:hypothetical protein
LVPNGQKAITDIDGYRVYENDFYFQHALVAATTAGPADKVTMFRLPVISLLQRPDLAVIASAGSLNRCFVARAYKGTVESGDSNTFCIGDLPGTQTVDLNPLYTKIVWNVYTNFCAGPDMSNDANKGFYVGYHFENYLPGAFNCGGHLNQVYRSVAIYDMKKITGPVWRAALKYQLGATFYGENEQGRDPNSLIKPIQYPTNLSCAVELMLPTQDWDPRKDVNTGDDLVPAEDYISLPENGTAFQADVTSAVSHWHNYGGNYGFEFRGAKEDTGADEDSDCRTQFSLPVLEVTFFP